METWLKCKVSPGQFSIEYAVQGETFNGDGFSMFAPANLVEVEAPPSDERSVDGWLRVETVQRQGNLVLVRLPREALENGQFVTVREEQLQSRTAHQEA